jgi:hypothetical protein
LALRNISKQCAHGSLTHLLTLVKPQYNTHTHTNTQTHTHIYIFCFCFSLQPPGSAHTEARIRPRNPPTHKERKTTPPTQGGPAGLSRNCRRNRPPRNRGPRRHLPLAGRGRKRARRNQGGPKPGGKSRPRGLAYEGLRPLHWANAMRRQCQGRARRC